MATQEDSSESISYRGYYQPQWRRREKFKRLLILEVVALSSIVAIFILLPIRGILYLQEQTMAAQLQGMQKLPELDKKLTRIETHINALTTNRSMRGSRLLRHP